MIPKQLHVGKEMPSPYRIQPIRNRPHFCKPLGGLWTSTFDLQRGSDWIQWCLYEQFNVPKDNVWNGYILIPARDARLFIIDSEQDLIDMLSWYGELPAPEYDYNRYPNFENMLSDFDGIRLTEQGEKETRLSRPHNLYGWDCESTLWFRWKFTDVEHVRIHMNDDCEVVSVEYIKQPITA